jgi:hypothetical protein
MVLGIVGCILFVIPFLGFPLSLLAIVFGLIGQGGRAKGMATAGFAMGLVTFVLSIASLILWLTYPR